MRILIIADPWLPVPPNCYGGAERVISLYASEFQRLGHQVDLIAAPGSQSYGGKIYLHSPPSNVYASRAYRKLLFQLKSLHASRICDVVFNHGRFDYLKSLLILEKPLLHLFHAPVAQAELDYAQSQIRSNVAFQFISNSQVSSLKVHVPSFIIPNPVDTRAYQQGEGNGNYLAFLGRLVSDKGIDVAIEVARRTGMNLIIAGGMPNSDHEIDFFRHRILPSLCGNQIKWIGPVDDSQKQVLLSNAAALLFPIRWDEPFGLVMIEALACGTPVIATRRGSTPEVIDHGVTGWLCDPEEPSVDAFVEAVHRLPELDRNNCRISAETRFDVRVSTPRVLEVLGNLVD